MKWIISIFIVLDCAYQLFGSATSVNWCIFYDLIHYGVLLSICVYYAYKHSKSLLGVLSLYFVFVIVQILSQVGLDRNEYLKNIQYDYVSFCYFTIFILLIFINYKLRLWERLKRK
jgi:hypothetical protein